MINLRNSKREFPPLPQEEKGGTVLINVKNNNSSSVMCQANLSFEDLLTSAESKVVSEGREGEGC